jgi:porphobilinogen synthase
MNFPSTRMRRNRRFSWVRDLIAESKLSVKDLILPVFVVEGEGIKQPLSSMPGVYKYSLDALKVHLEEISNLGIASIALFPIIPHQDKDEEGSEAHNGENLIARAIRTIKHYKPGMGVICDVALDPYTTHGHDGIITEGKIDNDATMEALGEQALVLAKAGADMIAPSDMMDGRISYIREYLDFEGFTELGILAYSAKFASNFYSPFREAINVSSNNEKDESLESPVDKKTYQLDFRNHKEAMKEIELDISEGADIVMIKPASFYSDIIGAASEMFSTPVFAYQVSGEYAMLKTAADKGIIDFYPALIESLTSLKRAGASGIITYGAYEVANYLKESENE